MNVRELYAALATLPADAEVRLFIDDPDVPAILNSVEADSEIVYLGAVVQ
jgi:hypothetical protein